MSNLLKILEQCAAEDRAIGHFNISNLEMLKAISHVADKLNIPIVVGTSEGERDYLGIHHSVDLIKSYNKEHRTEQSRATSARVGGYHLFLNADHTRSMEKLEDAAREGYDMVIFDAADKPLEENIKLTREAVERVKKINSNIIVEGELGYIGKSSRLLTDVPEGARINLEDLPAAEEAKRFVEETGVDLLAPAVGNIHGMMKGAANPNLQIERIREIREATGVPLVLHGGSGVSDGDFRNAIEAGISLVHISTEMRVAWRKALEKSLKDDSEEIAPYKILPATIEAIESVVESRTRIFMGL